MAIDSKKYAKGTAIQHIAEILSKKADADTVKNLTANDIKFTSDLTITANVGVHTVGSTGSKTLPTTGKTVKQVMDLLFAEERNPSITQPSVALTFSNRGAVEVGTRVVPSYSASLNAGNYQYGPATAVTATSWEVSDNASHKLTTAAGKFPELQVIDSTNYSITAKCNHSQGVIPVTNLGNNYEAGRIVAGSKTTTVGSITGYRNSFYGTVTNKNTITNDVVRALNKTNRALANGNTIDISIPVGALRVVFAYPDTLREVTSVKDVNGLNAEIKSSFKSMSVAVSGANGYTAKNYRVYYLDYANPNNKTNTYKVTI